MGDVSPQPQHDAGDDGHEPAPLKAGAGLLALAALGVAGFVALGVWQLERRSWKLDLIARVTERVHGPPVAAPGRASWSSITPSADEYRRVQIAGHFLNDRETLVRATTELGSGFWVMTPLQADRGFTVLVNRGFVPPERRHPAARAGGQVEGETTIVGLLRTSQPGGGILRANDPAQDRWYSRDVAAIARTRGLGEIAPYFIDAEGTRPGGPIGGLTVIAFRNEHLVYALTWFALALLLAGGMVIAVRRGRTG